MAGRHERKKGHEQEVGKHAQDRKGAEQPTSQDQDAERAAADHEPWVNQHRDEPLPASHRADSDQPDAPATQIAAAENEDQGGRIGYVANAVPGKPDGEVDTRP
jgi:hypothetical protein